MSTEEKDLHYFITRIINPDFNGIVASLRSSRPVIYGRDGYTGLKWTDRSISDELASRLEEWRDNLWYKYDQDFPENGKAILDEFFEILVMVEVKLSGDHEKRPIIEGLWNLAKGMGEYLGLGEYVFQKAEEVKKRAAEIRERDRYLREQVKDTENPKEPSEKYVSLPRYVNPPPEKTLKKSRVGHDKKQSRKKRIKKFFGKFNNGFLVMLWILVIMYIWAFISPAILLFSTPPEQDMSYVIGNPKPLYFYDIDSSCSDSDVVKITSSLKYLSQKTGIRFVRLSHPIALVSGGISYYCENPHNYNAAGEQEHGFMGISFIIISWNKVRIPREYLTGEVILHETLHAMGFGHSSDPNSIMYPYARGNSIITDDLSNFISKYYKSPIAYLNILPTNMLLGTVILFLIRRK